MENAGKAEDLDYIRTHYENLMEEYRHYKQALLPVFGEPAEEEDTRPVADDFLVESVYEAIRDAAESMDITAREDTIEEMKDYAMPENEKERFEQVKGMKKRSLIR